jgi:hypothetical protein
LSPQTGDIGGSQGTLNLIAACARIHWAKGQFDTYFELFVALFWQNLQDGHHRHFQLKHTKKARV